jgi:hypothetical protein
MTPKILLLCVSAAPCLFLPLSCSGPRASQPAADPTLVAEIDKIKAIDNHGHPLHVVAEGEKPDDEYDALVFEDMEPFPSPVRIRPDNPEYISAWRALYGYQYDDMTEPHVRELMEAKKRMMRAKGDGYPAWVLNQLGIETMLANRVAMGRGLTAPRFRWVSMIDALIFPLNNDGARQVNPDYRSFYTGIDRVLKRYLAESNLNGLPGTLEEYLKQVVTPTLERQKREGAVAVKFEAAYLRWLDFAEASEADAQRVYASYAKGAVPPSAEYKTLQDYLFRYIAREAGRLGLPMHFHDCYGAGAYYQLHGSDPQLLESVFNDPTLRKTNFVLIHGGWPFTHEVGVLLLKPNVYTDTSAMAFVLYPRTLSAVLREWLELMPEKVLFGTDVEPFMPQVNWEETGWQTTTTVRRALAIELARMVLRENAARLYGFK